ncbi:MAG: DUF1206 domain-containing protein [Deltaproteobacteria bacterium]|nr:DUF1206 domain-containing protein [Deltaproteobacteria bacterium]
MAPWIERLARLGYVAKAVLYMTIGALAAGGAVGYVGGKTTGTRGAMKTIVDTEFGRVMLAGVALGLFGYAVWRVIEGITDPERRGSNAKGIALRISFVVRGLVHGALAVSAAKLVMGGHVGSDGDGSKHWVARALEVPGGRYLLWATAGALFGFGVYQLYRAWATKLSEKLELGSIDPRARRVIVGISRFGIAARGIVFATLGVLFARAASHLNAKEVGGTPESMNEILRFGKWPFIAVSVGLIAYGLYELLNARFRRIRVT